MSKINEEKLTKLAEVAGLPSDGAEKLASVADKLATPEGESKAWAWALGLSPDQARPFASFAKGVADYCKEASLDEETALQVRAEAALLGALAVSSEDEDENASKKD